MIREAIGASPVRMIETSRPAQPVQGGAAGSADAAPVFSPRLRLDVELSLVVLEFRTSAGELRSSIPSSRELDAYRRDRATGAPDAPQNGAKVDLEG